MLVAVDDARDLCRTVFEAKLSTPAHIADVVVDVLVEANLRGIDSHGITLLPYYLDKAAAKQIVTDAEPVPIQQSPAAVVLDAQQAIGHYASLQAMDAAIRSARQLGLGAATVRQSTHNGAISYYTIHAARQGMIGLAATACAPHVAPHGGTSGLHGTNPISYAFPRSEGHPLVFDLATGHSFAKLKSTADRDSKLSSGQLLSASGQPTTNPADMQDGWILPVAGHIGFGLGLLVDGLTAALSDSPIGRQMPLVNETEGPYHGSFFALAISPEAFTGTAAFESRISDLVEQIEKQTPQDTASPVRWPGQRGWDIRRKRIAEGIPIANAQWQNLIDALSAHGIVW